MTEPVAYMLSDFVGNDFTSLELPKNPNNPRGLYFKEQLHPRVKMTQAEFDEFSDLASYSKLIGVITHLYDEHVEKYPLLFKRFCGDNDTIKLAVLWSLFDPDNPEETIEIVPEKKWFVRAKKPEDEDEYYLFLSGSNLDDLDYFGFDYAKAFDTKEEAELWVNPLCEAVLLPIEGSI